MDSSRGNPRRQISVLIGLNDGYEGGEIAWVASNTKKGRPGPKRTQKHCSCGYCGPNTVSARVAKGLTAAQFTSHPSPILIQLILHDVAFTATVGLNKKIYIAF